jgi:hypothetical protein
LLRASNRDTTLQVAASRLAVSSANFPGTAMDFEHIVLDGLTRERA